MERLAIPPSGKSSGLGATELTIGRLVTLSANTVTGDRSLVGVIWEIIGANPGHVLLSCRGLCETIDQPLRPRLVAIREYGFYPAEDMAAALKWAAKPNER